MFLKRKATALCIRVERLVDSLSSAALTSCDESGLHVKFELIDELHGFFRTQLLLTAPLTPGVFGTQQRQPRHRATFLFYV